MDSVAHLLPTFIIKGLCSDRRALCNNGVVEMPNFLAVVENIVVLGRGFFKVLLGCGIIFGDCILSFTGNSRIISS